MTKLIVTTQFGDDLVFEDVIGHQIGNGAVQIMNRDGTQNIYNNFREIFVDLDDEEKATFTKRIDEAEKAADIKMLEMGAANDKQAAEVVVPLKAKTKPKKKK